MECNVVSFLDATSYTIPEHPLPPSLTEINRNFESWLASLPQDVFSVYVLELSDKSLYVGQTRRLKIRLIEHIMGEGGRSTRQFPPTRLLRAWIVKNRGEAESFETQVNEFLRFNTKRMIRGDTRGS